MGSVLVFAGGKPRPWEAEHGPRHLLPIEGEPLLARAVKMLKERGFDPTVVGPLSFCHHNLECDLFAVKDDTYFLSSVLSSKPLWNDDGPTFLLWGDTVWSPSSLDQVLGNEMSLCFFLGKPAGTLGIAFSPAWHRRLIADIEHLLILPDLSVKAGRDGRRLPGHLHRSMLGFDVLDTTSPRDVPHPYHSKVWGSYTRDIDTWEAYLSVLERMNNG